MRRKYGEYVNEIDLVKEPLNTLGYISPRSIDVYYQFPAFLPFLGNIRSFAIETSEQHVWVSATKNLGLIPIMRIRTGIWGDHYKVWASEDQIKEMRNDPNPPDSSLVFDRITVEIVR